MFVAPNLREASCLAAANSEPVLRKKCCGRLAGISQGWNEDEPAMRMI